MRRRGLVAAMLGAVLLVNEGVAQGQSNCADLGPAKGWNVFVAGDFGAPSSDVEGSLAAGGNVTVANYSIGFRLTPPATVLVVDHDLVFTSGWIYGDVYYGGAATYPYYPTSGAMSHSRPIDFVQAFATLHATSSTLSTLPTTGTTTAQWGGLYLTGSDPQLNVFRISGAQVASSWGLSLQVPSSALVLVEVSGSADQLINMNFDLGGLPREHVLYHFPDATTLAVRGVSVEGSVLAPLAAVQFDSGVIQGSLVAASFNGAGQVNDYPFVACIPLPTQGPCAVVTCSALDSCHVAGTCNSATGICSNPLRPDAQPFLTVTPASIASTLGPSQSTGLSYSVSNIGCVGAVNSTMTHTAPDGSLLARGWCEHRADRTECGSSVRAQRPDRNRRSVFDAPGCR